MKVVRVGFIAAAVLAMATLSFAQKPDFSGTWTLDEAASGTAGGGGGGGRGGGGLGNGGTVKQTADALMVERMMGDNKVTASYKLDGSESKNTMMGRGGQSMEAVSTVKFDGSKMIITSKVGENDSTQVWSLAGDVLTIETTNARGHAEEGLQEDDVIQLGSWRNWRNWGAHLSGYLPRFPSPQFPSPVPQFPSSPVPQFPSSPVIWFHPSANSSATPPL